MTVRPRGHITSLTLTTRLQDLQLQPATCNQALFAVPHCKGVDLAHDSCGPLVLDPPTSTPPGGIPSAVVIR